MGARRRVSCWRLAYCYSFFSVFGRNRRKFVNVLWTRGMSGLISHDDRLRIAGLRIFVCTLLAVIIPARMFVRIILCASCDVAKSKAHATTKRGRIWDWKGWCAEGPICAGPTEAQKSQSELFTHNKLKIEIISCMDSLPNLALFGSHRSLCQTSGPLLHRTGSATPPHTIPNWLHHLSPSTKLLLI